MERITPGTGFYIEYEKEEIRLFTKHSCSVYPIWLGKNRAVMKKALAELKEYPPETLVAFLELISKYKLTGLVGSAVTQTDLLKYRDKSLDKNPLFF